MYWLGKGGVKVRGGLSPGPQHMWSACAVQFLILGLSPTWPKFMVTCLHISDYNQKHLFKDTKVICFY